MVIIVNAPIGVPNATQHGSRVGAMIRFVSEFHNKGENIDTQKGYFVVHNTANGIFHVRKQCRLANVNRRWVVVCEDIQTRHLELRL